MSQNRHSSPRVVDRRTNRPRGTTPFEVTDPNGTVPKASRARPVWTNSAATLGPFISLTGRSAAVALRRDDVGVPVPPDAVGAFIMVQISNNTSTAGTVNFCAYANLADSGGVGAGAVAVYGVPNVNASSIHRTTLICPLVGHKLQWEATISGAVAFDIALRLVGFIRA